MRDDTPHLDRTALDGQEIDRLAGQVIVAGFPAGPPPEALLALSRRGALGGFILFKRNIEGPEQVRAQNRDLRAAFPEPAHALIAVDQEGGRVARLGPPVLKLPPMRRFGQWDDVALTEEVFAALGAQLRWLGFNVDMAPVLDVDTNPDNPVIGDRSFGEDPERVIRHGLAVVRGLGRAGVMACGKHFPGHGDTYLDSHVALPRLPHGRARLDAIELRPFATLASTLPSIMTAHVVFEQLARDVPATLAPEVITGLLRAELGFQGLVMSDDLEMRALADHHSTGDAACLAIAAGCDLLLICSDVGRTVEAHAALVARAQGDPIFAARLAAAAARVRASGAAFPCHEQVGPMPDASAIQARLQARLEPPSLSEAEGQP